MIITNGNNNINNITIFSSSASKKGRCIHIKLRESSFNMTRGRGEVEDIEGGSENF